MKRLSLVFFVVGILCFAIGCKQETPKAPVPLDEPRKPLIQPQAVAVEMPIFGETG